MRLDKDLLRKFNKIRGNIKKDLFIDPEGIHGVGHAERVLFLALNISKLENYDQADQKILTKAAKFHDIGRTHNGVCLVHGMLSNRKIEEYDLLNGFSSEEKAIAKYIVHNHCIDDKNTRKNIDDFGIGDKDRALRLLKALKDSDGLDRVRIGDLDPNYLRTPSSKGLINLAEVLLREGIPLN